jgi:hypothetical protein
MRDRRHVHVGCSTAKGVSGRGAEASSFIGRSQAAGTGIDSHHITAVDELYPADARGGQGGCD